MVGEWIVIGILTLLVLRLLQRTAALEVALKSTQDTLVKVIVPAIPNKERMAGIEGTLRAHSTAIDNVTKLYIEEIRKP